MTFSSDYVSLTLETEIRIVTATVYWATTESEIFCLCLFSLQSIRTVWWSYPYSRRRTEAHKVICGQLGSRTGIWTVKSGWSKAWVLSVKLCSYSGLSAPPAPQDLGESMHIIRFNLWLLNRIGLDWVMSSNNNRQLLGPIYILTKLGDKEQSFEMMGKLPDWTIVYHWKHRISDFFAHQFSKC